MVNAVLVKAVTLPAEPSCICKVESGVAIPIPNSSLESSQNRFELSSVTAEPEVKRTEPAVYDEGVSERLKKSDAPLAKQVPPIA